MKYIHVGYIRYNTKQEKRKDDRKRNSKTETDRSTNKATKEHLYMNIYIDINTRPQNRRWTGDNSKSQRKKDLKENGENNKPKKQHWKAKTANTHSSKPHNLGLNTVPMYINTYVHKLKNRYI